jgi:transcriptional regulator with XRE-family HTH domain
MNRPGLSAICYSLLMSPPIPDRRAIGAVVLAIRLAQGRTQKDVAAQAGVGDAYLSLVETGKRRASRYATIRLADALGVDADVLSGQTPPIRALREIANLAPWRLAADLGINTAKLDRLEHGLDTPSALVAERLCRRLGLDPGLWGPDPDDAA